MDGQPPLTNACFTKNIAKRENTTSLFRSRVTKSHACNCVNLILDTGSSLPPDFLVFCRQ